MEKKPGRTVQFHFYATEQEATLISERQEASGIQNTSAYLRKMAIDGFNIQLDLSEIREMVALLRRCSNNLNQYARRANENGSIYAADIEDLRQQLDRLWDVADRTLAWLARVP